MSQRRSYPNSGDFNLDDLFRPEPGQQQAQPTPPHGVAPQPVQPQQAPFQQPQPPHQPQPGPYGQQPSGQPEYFGEGGYLPPGHGAPVQQQGGWAPQADPAPETQHLPPYPSGDPHQQGGYAAAPAGYPQQAQPYQPESVYQSEPAYQPEPAYPQQAQAQPGEEPPARRNRPSGRLIAGGVVAGCAAAGILVAVLMGGGEDPTPDKKTPVAATSGNSAGQASGTGSGAPVDPAVKAQAQALSDLLGTASDSRTSVVSAVASVQKCDKLPESQQALTAAAGKRRELQTKLGQLKTDKLPGGQQLVDQLNAAWTASASADDEYAAWAGDMQGGCDAKKTDNQHYKNAVASSGTATTAKKQASTLWGTVAGQTGLPTRTDGDL
ncbi:hypothetical protein [Streptomyces sp. NRRL WC-3742]|uniref:hypothetical protein n=1 Tax=Streptomyces sp. NRRL WC-3742 TaxID=1463934 RepID=UPI0004CC8ACE|nr:hypothetical protein [Streptomyces sp. NRRL WC-3742]